LYHTHISQQLAEELKPSQPKLPVLEELPNSTQYQPAMEVLPHIQFQLFQPYPEEQRPFLALLPQLVELSQSNLTLTAKVKPLLYIQSQPQVEDQSPIPNNQSPPQEELKLLMKPKLLPMVALKPLFLRLPQMEEPKHL